MPLFIGTIIAIIAAILLPGCHKKSNNTTSPKAANFTGCRVTQVVEGGSATYSTTYTFSYNDDGTVSTIKLHPTSGDSYLRTITYKSNRIIVSTTDNSYPYSIDSLLLDTQNRVVYIYHFDFNGGSPNGVYDQYCYDSSGNLTAITSHYYSTVSSQNFQWANGDIVWSTSGTDYYTYIYDTSLYKVGNISARISDLENYGRGIYAPHHLYAMAVMDSVDTINYSYTTDSNGNITSIKEIYPGNDISSRVISYECE